MEGVGQKVYVKHDAYEWLPADLLDRSDDGERTPALHRSQTSPPPDPTACAHGTRQARRYKCSSPMGKRPRAAFERYVCLVFPASSWA